MAGWHHLLDGRKFEWTPGVGDGQGGLECCDSWGCGESDTTEQLNWTELNWTFLDFFPILLVPDRMTIYILACVAILLRNLEQSQGFTHVKKYKNIYFWSSKENLNLFFSAHFKLGSCCEIQIRIYIEA